MGEYFDSRLSDEEEYMPVEIATDTNTNSPQELVPENTSALSRRWQQNHASKQRELQLARVSLRTERLTSRTWKPKRVISVCSLISMSFNDRWKCEQPVRAHTTHFAMQKGVNIHETTIKFQIDCRNKRCNAIVTLNWRPKSGN